MSKVFSLPVRWREGRLDGISDIYVGRGVPASSRSLAGRRAGVYRENLLRVQ